MAKEALVQARQQWQAKELQLQEILNLEVTTRQVVEQRLREQVVIARPLSGKVAYQVFLGCT